MKKVSENPRLDSGAVILYLNDILGIIDTMQAVNKDGKLEIMAGGYEFSDVDEISKLKQKEFESIKINYATSAPFSNIDFSVTKKSSHIFCYSSSDSMVMPLRGAFSSIEKTILANQRKWQWLDTYFYVVMSLGTSVSVFLLLGQVNQNHLMTYIGFGIAAIMLITLALYLFTMPVRISKVILVDKAEHDTFWKRNKDTILVSSFSSIISFLFGVLGTLFIQWLSK